MAVSYEVKKVLVENDDWNYILQTSIQATPFCRKDVLDAVGFYPENYIVYKNGKPYMGFCLPINQKTGCAELPDFAVYQGFLYLYSDENYPNYHNNLEATDFLLNYLYDNKEREVIIFTNSCYVKDIRSVQWHHYHERQKGMYDIEINYTGMIDADDFSLEKDFSKGRKLDYRYSTERYGVTTYCSNDITDFMVLYDKTFRKQDIILTDDKLNKVKKLVNVCVEKGIGKLWYAKDSDGNNIDAIFIITEHDRSYYMFGANDPDARKKGGGTLLLAERLLAMKDEGIQCFDFIGINSPYRGDFKLSFGAKIKPYYICSVDYRKMV